MNILNLIKNLFYICVGFCFLTAFSSNIEVFLGENEYFSWLWSINSLWLLDFLVILAVLFYTSLKISDCEINTPSTSFTYLFSLSIVFYTYERFFSDYFEFTSFKLFAHLKSGYHLYYLDVLYWVALLHFSGYLKQLTPENKKESQKNILLEDAPIQNNHEDSLSGLFKIPADKIYKIILENKFHSSFTIGLNGEWGDGKTSIFNIVKENLKCEKDYIIVDFDPWMGFDKKVLIKDFFNSLSESLGTNFTSELSEYSNEILNNGEENILIKILQFIWQKKDESINSTFDRLNVKIGNLNKKIIVFIDDVDRLDKEEVFEILKLIRKTANFQNTFFVVAYDRNYVNNSIKEHSGTSAIKYLDKIINIEISLPYFDKTLLKNYFVQQLKNVIPSQLHYKIDHFMKSYEKDPLSVDLGFNENDLFLHWVNNFREIKKVINSIIIGYNTIYKQVNFIDVINLEILKLKHPQLYSYLYVKQAELLSVHRDSNCYYLTPIDKVKASNIQFEEFSNRQNEPFSNKKKEKTITVFDFYLDEYVVNNNVNNVEKERILDLVNRLFIRWNDSDSWNFTIGMDSEDELSVKYVNKFERYFSHTIFAINISEDEFEEFLSLDENKIREKIISWSNEKLNDLGFRLNRKFNFKNEKDYKNTIIASLILLRMEKDGIYIHQLIGKMFGRDLVPTIFASTASAKKFFIDLFSLSKGPFLYEVQTLTELRKRNRKRGDYNESEKFPLSDDEINSLLKGFILDYIGENILFNNEFWSLYFGCQKLNTNGVKEPFEDVNNLVLDKLKNEASIIQFLKSLIIYDGYGHESIIRKGAIENLFGSYDKFENDFLETIPKNPYVNKFIEYYNESKNQNWEYIEFEYDFIKKSLEKQ